MCEALRIEARYNTPDSNGETRRQRNARFGESSPEPNYPERGRYLWEWYQRAARTRRYDQGMPQLLTPLEWQAWASITGQAIREEEFAVLMDMDFAYVSALRAEKAAQWARENQQNKGKRNGN